MSTAVCDGGRDGNHVWGADHVGFAGHGDDRGFDSG